jgi:hypothetical protein
MEQGSIETGLCSSIFASRRRRAGKPEISVSLRRHTTIGEWLEATVRASEVEDHLRYRNYRD